MEKKIVAYKLKADCIKYADAADSVIKSNSFSVKTQLVLVEHINSIKSLTEAGLLDLWFEPIYEIPKTLPTINGYTGESPSGSGCVKYGCATMSYEKIKRIVECEIISSSRRLASIKLDSGVEITMKQMKQIVDYYKK